MKSINNFENGLYEEWELEKVFHVGKTLTRLCQSWEIPVVLSALYLLMVFGGKAYMKTRNSFNLRSCMFVWSSILATFSIIGTYRTISVGLVKYQGSSIREIVCTNAYYDEPITRVWVALFVSSKFVEYFDTAFIILRKQNLIFLHWYHHLTVALFCWLTYGQRYAGGYTFMTFNYLVHAFMYTYYAFRAAGFRPPRLVSIWITFVQIVQMIVGCLVMSALVMWANDSDCISPVSHQVAGCVMYFSYLVLFVHFFYNTYLSGNKKKELSRTDKKPNNNASNNGNYETGTNLQNSVANGSSFSLRKRNK